MSGGEFDWGGRLRKGIGCLLYTSAEKGGAADAAVEAAPAEETAAAEEPAETPAE